MSNEEVTYTSLRFLQSSSESQNRLRPDGTQRPGKTEDKVFSVPWHLIAITLGILCLLLLMTVAVLVMKIFQYKEKRQQEILGNGSQKYHIMQNDIYLKEQLLINKTLEYDILKNETLQQKKELESFSIGKKRCDRKKENLSKCLQNAVELCDQWSCCGVNCYYFTVEEKDWNGCKQTCQRYGSSLLTIDDEDEKAFIQPQTNKNNYWIGLSYDKGESKWKWIDVGTSGINLTIMSWHSGSGQCAFLTSTRIEMTDCSKIYNCICEKRIDCIFPASMHTD
ncbi:PREDICTED: killer cell lectin-like receptor 2 [Galeopterus variegatus]|uniref:Killer cell lectin-like receptor 2 n=1 Tax=Galeopterus variegatus TaxID=482537 RepID=A0ABM0RZU0_GALVR|nr:PREDICTED: killer cell lectin-like receptor 2 [Galeopterus variegatus]